MKFCYQYVCIFDINVVNRTPPTKDKAFDIKQFNVYSKNTFYRTSKSKILENIKLMQIMLAEMLTLLMASRIMSYIMDLTVDTSVTQRRITIDIKTSIFHAYFAFSVFTV